MIEQAQNFINDVGVISFMTFSATALGGVSLLLSNFARYFQARKFGIPIKALHQANISDSMGIWITLLGALGFGIFVPLLLLYAQWGRWPVYVAMVAALFVGLSMGGGYTIRGKKKETEFNGKVFLHDTDATWMFHLVVSLLIPFAYLRVRNVYRYDLAEGFFHSATFYFALFWVIFYVIALLLPLFFNLRDKLFGGEKMITEIDGALYLVAMRSSQYHWLLVPCEILTKSYTVNENAAISGTISSTYVGFEKNTFIVRDLSGDALEIKRLVNCTLIEKGELKEAHEEPN